MLKFQILIFISILLLATFVILLIVAIVKRTKKFLHMSLISFALFICTGTYTIYYMVIKGTEKTFEVIEKIFPPFDSDITDTEANKKNFRNFLKVEITPDVKNIYCFDDAIGQDADYMFAFDCDTITKNKIAEEHLLVRDSISQNVGEFMQHDFPWWDKEKLKTLPTYYWNSEEEGKNLHKLFWYDEKNGKAYYFEYDL